MPDTEPLSVGWLAQIIRGFLRHPSETWKDGAAVECAELINFSLREQSDPDWSDVRAAARAAGWTHFTEPVGLRPVATELWAYFPPSERLPDVERAGCVRFGLAAHGLFIELHGPGKYPRERADLINPTPAKFLAVARALGLGGDSDV
jgi:hypothetical protein